VTRPGVVQIHQLERLSRPWLPWTARAGSTLQGADGELVRVLADGCVDLVVQGGLPHPGVAADAVPRRAA
jgi:hypothetical protein